MSLLSSLKAEKMPEIFCIGLAGWGKSVMSLQTFEESLRSASTPSKLPFGKPPDPLIPLQYIPPYCKLPELMWLEAASVSPPETWNEQCLSDVGGIMSSEFGSVEVNPFSVESDEFDRFGESGECSFRRMDPQPPGSSEDPWDSSFRLIPEALSLNYWMPQRA